MNSRFLQSASICRQWREENWIWLAITWKFGNDTKQTESDCYLLLSSCVLVFREYNKKTDFASHMFCQPLSTRITDEVHITNGRFESCVRHYESHIHSSHPFSGLLDLSINYWGWGREHLGEGANVHNKFCTWPDIFDWLRWYSKSFDNCLIEGFSA